MPQKRHTVDQIVAKLRKADVELGKGKKVPEVRKWLEFTSQTCFRWRQKYGVMKPEMAKQLKALEKENARLKKMVAGQAILKSTPVLREASRQDILYLTAGDISHKRPKTKRRYGVPDKSGTYICPCGEETSYDGNRVKHGSVR
jgi:hypothetical protein